MNKKKKENKKIQFIDHLVYFQGIINRDDIMKNFYISSASATNLLSEYNKIAPNNLDYNIRLKSYEISRTFKPVFEPNILLEHIPVYTIPKLNKPIDNEIDKLVKISRAIQRIQVLKIIYNSMSSGISTREVVPVAFANTHLRWHLRAYDRKRQQYADFVFRRISKVQIFKSRIIEEHEHPNNDKKWHLFINLKIKPRSSNLDSKEITNNKPYNIRIRSAMAGYFLELWNVDCSLKADLNNEKHQYVLKNIKQVSKLADLKLAPGYNE